MYISLARVSYMYYEEGLTQQQIANTLGISRMRVSRMLQQARDEGVVQISITFDGFYPHLERTLSQKYDGVEFVICDSLDESEKALKTSLGKTAADFLSRRITNGDTVAVGWGTTLLESAKHLHSKFPDTVFVPLIGGQVRVGLDVHANSIADQMARNSGGKSLKIFAPAVAESAESKKVLVNSAGVRDTLAEAVNADICVFSVGTPFSTATTIEKVGYYDAKDIEKLRKGGAKCDLISISYFSSDGSRCCSDLAKRTVSISETQLRAIPEKVCVAGGIDKHEAIRIALEQGLIDTLVTDERSAKYLAERTDQG